MMELDHTQQDFLRRIIPDDDAACLSAALKKFALNGR
jgi:hypothetical protein